MARPLPLLASLLFLLFPGGAAAQGFGGGPPRNLQVLPKDLTRGEVTARMRQIAMSLGVRCEHCHVQTTGPDGREQNDFASDDKDAKKVAREMMRMVNDINDKYLIAGMGRTLRERDRVTCETCHHGLSTPKTIQAAVVDAIETAGADSAVALYKSLRERYYGRAAYDFGELALPEVARLTTQRPAIVTLLKLNLEYYPRSVPTLGALAQQSLRLGDTAAAVDALTKALAIDPNEQQLRRLLGQLRPQ
jgi:hypothetical protein